MGRFSLIFLLLAASLLLAAPQSVAVAGCVGFILEQFRSQARESAQILRARQQEALRIIASDGGVSPELRLIARDKLQYFHESSDGKLTDGRLETALTVCLDTFNSPEYDAAFRPKLIEQLGALPEPGERAVGTLLKIARGAEFVQPGEIRQASATVARIVARGQNFPARAAARAGAPRVDPYDILFYEPIKAIESLNKGNANGTFSVTFADGSKAIFKPQQAELPPGFFEYQGRVNYTREVASDEIVQKWFGNAEAVKRGESHIVLPPTVEVVLAHDGVAYGPGSLQLFQEGFVTLKDLMKTNPDLWERIRHLPEWGDTEARIRTIDYIKGNHDRLPNSYYKEGNYGNVMIKVDPRAPGKFQVALIDNSMGSPGVPWFGVDNAPVAKDIPRDLARTLMNFDETGFRDAMQGHLPKEGIEDTILRVRAVQDRIRNDSPLRVLTKAEYASPRASNKFVSPFDLGPEPAPGQKAPMVSAQSGSADRVAALKGFHIADCVAPPGHARVSNGTVGDAGRSKIILNVVPGKSVDVWAGTEALVSELRAGHATLDQIDPARLEILVDGQRPNGEKWAHWVRAAGVDLAALPGGYQRVLDATETATISVDGALSNRVLGSRTSIGAVRAVSDQPTRPKVAVYFGTFDPFHEGHMSLVRKAREMGFDEVVVIPDYAPAHKAGATAYDFRLAMARSRMSGEDGVNVLIRNPGDTLGQFGMAAFLDQVGFLYGTKDVYTLIGRDAFDGIVKQGLVHRGMNDNFLVFGRAGVRGEPVPAGVGDHVRIVETADEGRSSTKVRAQIKSGQEPDPKDLHPSIFHIIKEQLLYR